MSKGRVDYTDEFISAVRIKSPGSVRRVERVLRAFAESALPIDEQVLERFFLLRCAHVQVSTAITDVANLKGYLRFLKRR